MTTSSKIAVGWHGGWYADCRDGKRRAVCHGRKLLGKNYIDKAERLPPRREWHDFFAYIDETREVLFQTTDRPYGPEKDRRLDYWKKVYRTSKPKYDDVTKTWSFKVTDAFDI